MKIIKTEAQYEEALAAIEEFLRIDACLNQYP